MYRKQGSEIKGLTIERSGHAAQRHCNKEVEGRLIHMATDGPSFHVNICLELHGQSAGKGVRGTDKDTTTLRAEVKASRRKDIITQGKREKLKCSFFPTSQKGSFKSLESI